MGDVGDVPVWTFTDGVSPGGARFAAGLVDAVEALTGVATAVCVPSGGNEVSFRYVSPSMSSVLSGLGPDPLTLLARWLAGPVRLAFECGGFPPAVVLPPGPAPPSPGLQVAARRVSDVVVVVVHPCATSEGGRRGGLAAARPDAVSAAKGPDGLLLPKVAVETGLLNAEGLYFEAGRLLGRDGSSTAMVWVLLQALPRFRYAFGHGPAEVALQCAAGRLVEFLRGSPYPLALLAQPDLQTLVVVLDRVRSMPTVVSLAHELYGVLSPAVSVAELSVPLDPAVGVSFAPLHSADGPEACRLAAAAALASSVDRVPVTVWSAELESAHVDRLRLAGEVASRLSSSASSPWLVKFKPQVGPDGCLVSAVASASFVHPERGVLPPARLWEVCASTGLLPDVALSLVGASLDRWFEVFAVTSVPVGVAVPGEVFDVPGFADRLVDCLVALGCPPSMLRLLVPYTSGYSQTARAALAQLAALQVRVALDRLPVGALPWVSSVPFDQVWLDRAFARHPPAVLLESVVTVADTIAVEVCATGVDSPGDAARFRAAGVPLLVGSWVGPPVPASGFVARYEGVVALPGP